ncbi:MAG: hypothetical protein ACXWLC_09655 [Rhizomicrobium sp.]
MMKVAGLAAVLLCLTSAAFARQMDERKGLAANEGCVAPSKLATGTVKTCAIAEERTRIWCPNGKVFDRDTQDVGIAVVRSICEMNQLPG